MILLPGLLWRAMGSLIGWLGSDVVLYHWPFVLLFASFVTCLTVAGIRLRKLYSKQQDVPIGPTTDDFVSFQRFNLIWRWEWAGPNAVNVTGFCPTCDRKIRHSQSEFNWADTDIYCTHCKQTAMRYRGSYNELLKDVRLEIEHAVRSGT